MTDAAPKLTAERVRQMPAGREMDVRVAVAVGYLSPDALTFLDDPDMMAFLARKDDDGTFAAPGPPHYSTDIAAAFELAERLAVVGWKFEVAWQPPDRPGEPGAWDAEFRKGAADSHFCVARTVPEAISKAALLATLETP